MRELGWTTRLMYSIQPDMDLRTRVTLLSESADRDGSGGAAVGPGSALMRPGDPVGITKVRYSGQGVTRLMRVMQTNACSLSCGYCPTFCGGKVRRTYLQPKKSPACSWARIAAVSPTGYS